MQDILKIWLLCWMVFNQNHLVFFILELIARDYDPQMGIRKALIKKIRD